MLTKQKIIYHKKIEIIIAIFIILASYQVWGCWNDEQLKEARKYLNTSYTYVVTDGKQGLRTYPLKDEVSLKNLVPTTIYLRNDTRLRSDYHLAIRVPKNNNLDFKYLKYSINGEVHEITSTSQKEDNDFYYFIMESGNLEGNEATYKMNLWLKEDTPISECTKSFTYDIVNIDNKIDM